MSLIETGTEALGVEVRCFVTAMDDEVNEEKGFKLCAVDYITKSFKRALVQLHLRLSLHQRLLETLVARTAHDLVLAPPELDILRQLNALTA